MGAGNSKQPGWSVSNPFTGRTYVAHHGDARGMLKHAGSRTQRKCQRRPRYVDACGWALTEIYGVPQSLLDKYPPTVYSVEQALQDIDACKAGRDLPHYRRVVRYDRVVGAQDPRVYALMRYHGYTAANFQDGRLLQLLPYSAKDAQIDVAYYQKHGRPYYTVIKATSAVIDPKRGTVRDWRHRGFDNKYRYDAYDPKGAGARIERLGGKVRAKLDVSQYPKKKVGGLWVRMVPCSVMPAMCAPGQKDFPYAGGDERSNRAIEVLEAKKEKIRRRRAEVDHSKKMEQLSRRMKGLNKESNRYRTLKAQRDQLAQSLKERRFQAKVNEVRGVYETV